MSDEGGREATVVDDADVRLPGLLPTPPGRGLADAIYTTLRDAIIRGALPPGYRLREVPLSEHFEVSSTPVRSALQRLDLEGLVEVSPRRGAIVAPVTRQQLTDLYELRVLLECHAVRTAAAAEAPDPSHLEAILEASQQVLDDPDQSRFNDLDLAFHAALTALGGNAELAAIAEQTHRRIQAVRVRHLPELVDQPATSHRQHLAVVDALRQGDPEAAATHLRDHIVSVRDAVLALVAPEG